jgi:GMP synthase-like glutamine amidotransferase
VKFLSVVQHTNPEWLGHMEDHFEGRGIRFGYHRPFASGRLPDVATIGDGLVLLGGGPWGAAAGPSQLPTCAEEVRLARACLMLDKVVIGIGVGAQILAIAADGEVMAAPLRFAHETTTRTKPDALAGLMPETFPSLVYMRDRPVPPDYADILARFDDSAPSVFQIGTRAFGFAAHPGIRRAMLEELVMEAEDPISGAADTLATAGAISSQIEDALVRLMAGVLRTSRLG